MTTRAPGHEANSPRRRWPGALVVFAVAVGLALGVGGFIAVEGATRASGAATDTASVTAAPVTTTTSDPTSESVVAAAVGEPDDDAADATPGTDAVHTLTLTLYDADRDRTIRVTVITPDTAGRYPLVVFAHGYAASAATYAELETEIAEAGFVVAAPDFPRSSSAVTTNPQRDIAAQAIDVSFVITALTDPAVTPDVAASVDANRIGVIGHSDGAVTADGLGFNTAALDTRIGAVVSLSGGAFGFTGSWFTAADQPALLAIHGTDDEINPFSASQSLYTQAAGPKMLVAVQGGSHLGPFTTDPTVGDVATLTADFLHAHLSNAIDAQNRLAADASTGALTLITAG